MTRSPRASAASKEGGKKVRLCACTIIVEVPEDMDPAEQDRMLGIIERSGLEEQALETIAWWLREKPILKKATARLEK